MQLSEATTVQRLVKQYDHEKADLKQLKQTLGKAEDALVFYLMRYSMDSSHLFKQRQWGELTDNLIENIDQAAKKNGRVKNASEILNRPHARAKLRRSYTKPIFEKIPDEIISTTTKQILGAQLKANGKNGTEAVKIIQSALVRAYIGAKIEQSFRKHLVK